MKKLGAAILIYFGLAIAALAQVVSWPPPAGTIAFLCVYNTSPPAFTNGQVGFVQCDNSGNIITSATSLSAGVANLSAALSGMNVNNASTSLALVGTNSVAATLSGTWVGTVTPYVSANNETTYVAAQFLNPTTQAFSASATANGTYSIIGTGGMTHVKLVLSPYTSGTVTGNLSATSQAPSDASALYGLSFQLGIAGTPSPDVMTTQDVVGMIKLSPVGTSAFATNQVSVLTSATLIVAARTGAQGVGRKSVTVINKTGSDGVCIGNTGSLTTSTGACLPAVVGSSATLDTQAAIYGIVGTTTQIVSYVETY